MPAPSESREPQSSYGPSRLLAAAQGHGFRLLYVVDVVGLLVAMHLITIARFGFAWPTFAYSHYLTGFVLSTAILLCTYYFGGMYEYERRLGRPPWLPRATAATVVGLLTAAGVALATGRYLMPRGNLLVLVFVASAVVSANRWFSGKVRSRRFGHPNVLLVGTDHDVALARDHMNESGSDATIAGAIGGVDELASAVETCHATDVLLLSGQQVRDIFPEPLEQFEQTRVGVYRRVMPEDTVLGLQRSREIASMPFVALRSHTVPLHKLRLKRLFDLVVMLFVSPILVALLGLAALYARVVAGPHILFRQERVGQFGKRFDVLKFRTMVPDAESLTGAVLASDADPRVVPGMRWFRSARVDELPQLVNVWKGQMSLVGPRPERPQFVSEFERELPGYARRHDIPPGITGLAQVRGLYQTDPAFKLGHDLQYIVNWSLVLDLEILAKTVAVVVRQSAR